MSISAGGGHARPPAPAPPPNPPSRAAGPRPPPRAPAPPPAPGVRPFTITGRETLAYTTATGFLGFQVSSIRTGRVLYTVSPGRRFRYDPRTFEPSAPSRGISLSPDERRLWGLDGPNNYVHVYDVSRVPRRRPRRIADVRLAHPMTGEE